MYANGSPLTKSGIIQGFVNPDLDCIGIIHDLHDSNTLSFSSIDCNDMSNFKPICQIPVVHEIEEQQDDDIFGKAKVVVVFIMIMLISQFRLYDC